MSLPAELLFGGCVGIFAYWARVGDGKGVNKSIGAMNMGKAQYGGKYMPRDVVGYGQNAPDPKWPNGCKVALNLVLNFEEGGEACELHGDGSSEGLLTEIVGCPPYPHQRHANVESLYDFGSRAGFWRLHRILTSRSLPCTVFAVGMALERHPEAARAMLDAKWEVASHGYRWIDYQNVSEEEELDHLKRTVAIHKKVLGHEPVGLYQGKPNAWTRSRMTEATPNFLYSADAYDDELPHFTPATEDPPHRLVVPYTLSENDMVFVRSANFPSGKDFSTYLIDHLSYLLEEARSGATGGKMMSVGLHCRLVGRAGRAKGLADFLDFAMKQDDVWICRRDEIAKHWYDNFWNPEWGAQPDVPIH